MGYSCEGWCRIRWMNVRASEDVLDLRTGRIGGVPVSVGRTIRVGAVGVDATDHGHDEDHELGLLSCEEGVYVSLATQVELGLGVQDGAGEAQAAELSHDGKADQAPMAGNEDIRRLVAAEQRSCCERERSEQKQGGRRRRTILGDER
ncbi:hypothetical protein FH972_002059 [Carpinus fangiana]|uniref:Uncharacterized protein n=1 Tax=Carpinus fangiana TaxID=176857 RepID=A0A5N6QGY7_9ROSI|nr:hypothetical protein FH972_002059 [Carpinus fangiana]